MATSGKRADGGSARDADSEVHFAGWDPYIVALTGTSNLDAARKPAADATSDRVEGRKIQLMAWLNEHEQSCERCGPGWSRGQE